MKKLLKNYSVFALLLAVLAPDKSFGQAHPWFENPSMFVHWTNFTALPTPATNNYSTSGYVFKEDYVVLTSTYEPKIWRLTSTNPVVYSEAVTNIGTIYPTSVAFATYNDDPPELFIGSLLGLYKVNRTSSTLDVVWWWGADALYIAGARNMIYGLVISWGGQSGKHLWATNTHVRLDGDGEPGGTRIWADPVSKNYGLNYYSSPVTVRMIDTNHSIIFHQGGYSTNGAASYSNVGEYVDGGEQLSVSVNDAYLYASDTVLVNNGPYWQNNRILIGKLGGHFESLNCPAQGQITVFHYDKNSRLLIAGNSSGLYSTVLPSETQILPELQIQGAVIVSWSTQYNTATLQGSTNVLGPWEEVTAPRAVVGDKVQVAISADLPARFFRLLLP